MNTPLLPDQLAIVAAFRSLEIFVRLSITAAEATTLSEDDVAALHELGATGALLDEVRRQAQAAPPDRIYTLDVDTQQVTIDTWPLR